MKAIISLRTGCYPLQKAIKIAEELNNTDDWKYVVIDCKNGLGKIDVYDEDNQIVVEGFII